MRSLLGLRQTISARSTNIYLKPSPHLVRTSDIGPNKREGGKYALLQVQEKNGTVVPEGEISSAKKIRAQYVKKKK